MGSIFRKTAVRDVPVDAKVITNPDGTDEAKWVPRGSRRPITALVVTLDGGRRVVEVPTGCWYAKYRDADGIVRTVSTRCRDENNAKQVLARLERDAERIRSGVMTRREADAADQRRSPIAQHIEGYIARLPGKRGGTATAMHRDNTRRYLTRLAAECLWECLADMTRDSLERWITSHSRPGPDGRPVRSARSINCHRAAAVAFANWCADPLIGRLPSNPFGTGQYGVPKADEDADPRRRRRAFSPDELFHLVDAAYNAPERRTAKRCEENDRLLRRPADRLSGRDRGDLWLFLAGTGLRVGEVKRLTVADVRLDAVPPHIRIPAAVAKSRKEQSVPLRADLVAMLRERLAGRKPTDPVFEIPGGLIRRFNADCRRAGIPKRDEEGRTVDIHSLRTTFATMLSRSGVTPRVAMELMRHSRIDLTMKVYTDPRLLPLAAAVEAMPSVVPKVVPTGGTNRHFPASSGTTDRNEESQSDVA